jgi:lipoprotein-anchoring transpeptidase ErfK/SrfK
MLALLMPVGAAAAATTTTPAGGRLTLSVEGAYQLSSGAVTVTGRSFVVRGVQTPYVAGQRAVVKIRLGRRVVKSGLYLLKPARHGTEGRFTIRFATYAPGKVSVNAMHAATLELAKLVAAPRYVHVVVPAAGPGSTGTFVSLIQSRLAALHYAVPRDGIYDQLTANAVLAYRKLRGFVRIFTLDRATIRGLLDGVGTFPVRYPKQGRHVEADLTDQVLALIDGSQVYAIYPISSGKPSTPTVLGTFQVYSKVPGYLPDGMYFSNFFYTGYAIHGYDPAPTYPASHGCLRLPIDEAIGVYDWVKLGTVVDVYYGPN